MNISWVYLDKRNASIAALKDYKNMKHILEHTNQEIKKEEENMIGCSSSPTIRPSKDSVNYHANEKRILSGIDAIDVLEKRYQGAKEFMDWFQPAWDSLSQDEQFVLSRFYLCEDCKQIDSIYEICERYHIERTSAYKKKDRALEHLTLMLYGK